MADSGGQEAAKAAVACASCRGTEDVQLWSPIPDDIRFPTCGPCRRFYAEWLPATTDAVMAAIDKLRVEKIEEEMNRNVQDEGLQLE